MKTHLLTAGIIAALALTGLEASAQGRQGGPDFATLDADGDGLITMAEIEAAPAARFAAADTDSDGAISVAEFTAAMAARMNARAEQAFARLDANADGSLTPDEMQPQGRGDRMTRMFDRLDADEDGAISAEEFETARARMADRRDGERRGGERGQGGHRDGHQGGDGHRQGGGKHGGRG